MSNAQPGGPTKRLSTGTPIPQLGLGVWQVPDGPDCERAVRWALDCGYRLIDTAQAYGNEASVGRALRASGIPREEIFLTTKFYPGRRDPRKEAVESLERLGTDYIDLYLIHWPRGGATWAWPGMEATITSGIARNVGVSNFGSSEIDELMRTWQAPPVVNQIQVSPFEYRSSLIDKSESEGLVVQAYSPLGTGRHLGHPVVKQIAADLGRTPAQVLIRWGIQKGMSVISKSTHQRRIEENYAVFDFELGEADMLALDSLDTTGHTDEALEQHRKWWP
jgi:diketogulonate reductase-like aldo/keto reductase